ncbi:MAG: class I SAM-dependent methyltransferase [bacterium]
MSASGERRRAVLVTIDGTICDMRHRLTLRETPAFHAREAILKDVPVGGSVEVLRELAKEYTIVYLGFRPAAALPQTEEWLAQAGFPEGLVQAAATQAERVETVRHLSRRFEFAAGIGDRWDDNELHREMGCPSIILEEFEGKWETVRRFVLASGGAAAFRAPASPGGATYRATSEIPPLVQQAKALTRRMRFELSCADEVGRLLHLLAGQVREGTIGEIGTGCGEGAAWMISALAPGVSFLTIDADRERAEACRVMFARYPNVRVMNADWHEILAHGPFDMLFPDGGGAKQNEPEAVISALRLGGVVLLDDLTPEPLRAAAGEDGPDPVREFFLNDRRVTATEILVTPAHAVILGRRVQTD